MATTGGSSLLFSNLGGLLLGLELGRFGGGCEGGSVLELGIWFLLHDVGQRTFLFVNYTGTRPSGLSPGITSFGVVDEGEDCGMRDILNLVGGRRGRSGCYAF